MTIPLVRGSPASADDPARISPFGMTYHKKAALPRVADGDEAALAARMIGVVKTVTASSNVTPCFSRFADVFCRSHSNRTPHLLALHQLWQLTRDLLNVDPMPEPSGQSLATRLRMSSARRGRA